MRNFALPALVSCMLAGAALAADPPAESKPAPVRPSLAVGSVPEDELGKDTKGNKIHVSDYHGKVVILSFWASWCAPCRKELPLLAGIVKRVGPDHLQVIAINFHDELKPFKFVVDVLKELPITILRDQNSRTSKKFDVRGIPRMIVIGRDGKVAADHTGYGEDMIPELVQQLNALLAQEI
jgi:thiol-disulfide isomerase/thioredoxin